MFASRRLQVQPGTQSTFVLKKHTRATNAAAAAAAALHLQRDHFQRPGGWRW